MQLGQAIQKVLDAFAQAKTGNVWAAGLLLLEVAQAVFLSFPPNTMRPMHAAAGVDYNSLSDDDLIALVEAEITPKMSSSATAGPPQGPVIDKILPILWVLIQRWLRIV